MIRGFSCTGSSCSFIHISILSKYVNSNILSKFLAVSKFLLQKNRLNKDAGLALTQRNRLIEIAKSCPDTYGELVFKARALLSPCEYAPNQLAPDCGMIDPNASIVAESEERKTLQVEASGEVRLLGPNPADKYLQLYVNLNESESIRFLMLNSFGQVAKTVECNQSGVMTIDLTGLPSGIYSIHGIGKSFDEKLIITR